ncbi:MAG: glycosyltransferase family 4 protein [Sedimentisphaerales bacterium]
MTKVCFVSPKAWPLFEPACKEVIGGAEVDIYLLVTELAKDKCFEISCITADYGQNNIEYRNGIKILKGVDFKINPVSGAIKLWQTMTQADADIYFQEAASAGTFLVAMWCKTHNRKFVYRTANQGECDGTYFAKNKLMRTAFAWSLRHAAAVFTQNDIDSKNILNQYGVCSEVLRNGQKIPEISSHKISEYILWVGRSTPLKRPELFIQLAQEMPDKKFVMICQQATGDRDYEKLAAEAGNVKNLVFIRRVSFGEIESYFEKASLLVNTSSSEGFPNTFVQACKWGVPVLSLAVNPDGFPDDSGCGISCSDDFQKFIDSLKYMLSENRYVEFGKNAKKYAEQMHDIHRIIEQYKKVLFKIFRNNE